MGIFMLNEGVHDHGALKFVFLAGGSGSGKNYVANQLFGIGPNRSFGASGMKMVSFDAIFEKVLEKNGYTTDLTQVPDEERKQIMNDTNPNSLYQVARKIMKKQLKNYMKAGIGIIFDGTGRDLYSYLDKKDTAEKLGYDTHLIYVDVPLRTALERNAKRTRRLPDEDVRRIYRDVKRNKGEFQRVFGDKMMTIDNADGAQIPKEVHTKVQAILAEPVKNPIGRYFMSHNGQRPPRKEKPTHKAPPTAQPLHHHREKDGSHSVYTSKGKLSDPDLFPGEKEALSRQKQAENPGRLPKTHHDQHVAHEQPPENKGGISGWWSNFKKKQADKLNKKKSDSQLSLKSLLPNQDRIHNPETGNDILVSTALGYPPNHPMRIAAEKFLKGK
jgi:predicted kinase